MKSRHFILSYLENFTEFPISVLVINKPICYTDILVISENDSIQSYIIQNFVELFVGKNEDALFFQDIEGKFDIAFLNYSEYIERFEPTKVWKHQAKKTNWAVGPWLLEGFWKDLQQAVVISDPLNCYAFYQENIAVYQKVLREYLRTEVIQKLSKYEKATSPIKEFILQDIRLAYLRIIFLSNDTYFPGLHTFAQSVQTLPKTQQQQVSKIFKTHKIHQLKLLATQII